MDKKRLIQLITGVTLIHLLSRFFGFFREIMVGYHFGTTFSADSVIIAYTIPNFLYIVVGGALTTSFISIYQKIPDEFDRQKFQEVIFTYVFFGSMIITLFFMMFPVRIIDFFFSGLTSDELQMTANLFQWMAPSVMFLILSMFLSGILNVHDQFYRSSLATLFHNALFVGAAFFLFPLIGIFAYGVGAVIGSLIMGILLVIFLCKGKLFRFSFRIRKTESDYLLRFAKVGLPILLGGATLQFYFLIHRLFASQLEDGFVSALNYSSKIVQLPQAILMTAVTTVIYPLLSKKVAEKDYHKLSGLYTNGLRQLFVFIVPVSIFVYMYADEIIKLVFEYGAFTADSTIVTAGLVKIFVISMFAHAANLYVTRFFYAMERAIFPVLSGVISVFGINIVIIILFIERFGANAIAWGTSISAYVQLVLLLMAGKQTLNLKGQLPAGKLCLFVTALIIICFLIKNNLTISFVSLDVIVGFAIFAIVTLCFKKLLKL